MDEAASLRAAVDAPLELQVAALEAALRRNAALSEVLSGAGSLRLPDWYIGAGGISQTVWNLLHGFAPETGIVDLDLVYFDPSDLGAEAEKDHEVRAARAFSDLGVKLDVTNEARVHLWYEERFGKKIEPYRSSEHAISTWPTTGSCVGVRPGHGGLVVAAPFGLRDLLAMVVRPNKAIIDQPVFDAKASRWAERWPELTIVPWSA